MNTSNAPTRQHPSQSSITPGRPAGRPAATTFLEHAAAARAALREIMSDRENGAAALSSESRMANLLQDFLPDAPREAAILVAAARNRVASALRDNAAQGMDTATAVRIAAAAFAEATMIRPEACEWAVSELALALGLTVPGTPGPHGPIAGPCVPPQGLDGPANGAAAATIRPVPDQPDAAGTAARPAGPQFAASLTAPGTARRRPKAAALVTAAAAALAVIAGLVIWAPWASPPVLRPAGLAASTSSTSSVTFSWSGPAAGPAPDRYVISRDGEVIGSIRGTITRYRDRALAPATTYHYQVTAVRDATRSRRSAILTASTVTPPVSAAILDGSWTVGYRVVRSPGGTFATGTRWADTWQFKPRCPSGPCAVELSGVITGPGNFKPMPFTATLTRAGAVYTGTSSAHIENCDGNTHPIRSTLSFRLTLSSAGADNRAWTASSWTGTMVLSSPYTSAGAEYCAAQTVTTTLSSSR